MKSVIKAQAMCPMSESSSLGSDLNGIRDLSDATRVSKT